MVITFAHLASSSLQRLAPTLGLAAFLSSGCTSADPSVAEKLEAAAKKDAEDATRAVKKRERPSDKMAPPTADEFRAWDRVDPEGEKHLYKWDKKNLKKMQTYWDELRCFEQRMAMEGDAALGAEPMSPTWEKWHQFKGGFIPFINGWQQRLFANEPRILEKSKFVGNIIEAHELVMNGLPKAYNQGDDLELRKARARWIIVNDKVKAYVEQLGGTWHEVDEENAKSQKKWDTFCEKALKPPKPQKGPKKRSTSI